MDYLKMDMKEFTTWMSFNIKIIFYMSFSILIFSLLISSINSINVPRCMRDDYYYDMEGFENKANDGKYYKTIELLAPNDENGNPSNLFFGKANIIMYNNEFNMEIYANLFVLNGNVYSDSKTAFGKYKVYLTKDDKSIYVGDLKIDGDGMYKLKYNNKNNQELLSYDNINIIYTVNDDDKQLLLTGK